MNYSQGDILLASLVFTSQTGRKQRPVLTIFDSGDGSGLRLPSVARIHKLATIEKAAVVRLLGKISSPDLVILTAAFQSLFEAILAKKRA